jgi:hypothetical protein
MGHKDRLSPRMTVLLSTQFVQVCRLSTSYPSCTQLPSYTVSKHDIFAHTDIIPYTYTKSTYLAEWNRVYEECNKLSIAMPGLFLSWQISYSGGLAKACGTATKMGVVI